MAMRLVVAFALVGACSCLHAPGPVGRGASPSLSVGKSTDRGNFGGSIKIQSGLSMPVPTRCGTVSALRGGSGEATVASLTTGLIKNIVGSGVLALSGGVAIFSNDPSKAVPTAMAIAIIAGIAAGYAFQMVGRVCLMTGAKTYKEAWAKTVGASTSWIPSAIVCFKTLTACLAFSVIVADLSRDLAVTAGLTGALSDRSTLLVLVTIAAILPLCMLRSFASLAPTAYFGIFGLAFTAAAMVHRLIDGSYAAGGKFYKVLVENKQATPSFGDKTSLVKTLILISSMTSSYLAHYNAPKFLNEITNGDKLKQFNQVTMFGFLGATVFNSLYMITGFLIFGGACKGLILNNFVNSDGLVTASRIGVLLAIIFGFPFSFVGFRDSFLQFMPDAYKSQQHKDALAVVTLGLLTATAMVVKDLGVVVAGAGALLGSCVIYVFPAMMFTSALKAASKAGGALPGEYYAGLGILFAGATMGILGVATVVVKEFYPHLLK